MTSRELTGWWALFLVHDEEAQEARDRAESGDGQVYVYGKDDDEDDGDDGDGAGHEGVPSGV